MHPGTDIPYDTRRPPGLRRRRPPSRWSRPDGTLAERLGRVRLAHLLGRAGSLGDWIALSLGALAVAAVLAAGTRPPAEGRIHAEGSGLARALAPGDLVAVETDTDAGWYRVEQVDLVACAIEAPSGNGLFMTTLCRKGQDQRAVIRAHPVRPEQTGWI